jgi:small neutral amino acid transporter SnatA (MarC family)
MSIFQLALTFFIVTNPIGNSPTIIALLKNHTISEQQRILFREAMFSMLLALFFLFLGEAFLNCLCIQNYALMISGGTILFILALKMIFSSQQESPTEKPKQDPFIVPIATPILSGGGLLTMIILYSKQEANTLKLLIAILIAWVGITAVLVTAPYMQIIFGKRGLLAIEQLMGMLLAMIAMEMIVKGSSLFVTALAGG